MTFIWIAIGFISGVALTGVVSMHKFLQYQTARDTAEAQQRAYIHNDMKEAVLEAALRGAGGPIMAEREEYFEM